MTNRVKLDRLGINNGAAIYATSDAGAPGQLAVGWYESDNGTPSSVSDQTTWTPHIAEITHATSAHPTIVEQAVTNIPDHRGGICLQGILCGIGPGSSDRSLLDFFTLIDTNGQPDIIYAAGDASHTPSLYFTKLP